MNKGKIYTLLIFILSVAVIFVGWIFTKNMLKQKEEEMLAKRGNLYVKATEPDLFEDAAPNSMEEKDGGNTSVQLNTVETEMVKVLTVWEEGGQMVLHEPWDGQINMEEAIYFGEQWIGEMAKYGILWAEQVENGVEPLDLTEKDFDKIGAQLCTLEQGIDVEVGTGNWSASGDTQIFDWGGVNDAMISLWTVWFIKGDVEIVLTIHAASGEVWRANISMDGDNSLLLDYSDTELLVFAFPFIMGSENKERTRIELNGVTYVETMDDYVYAAVRRYTLVADEGKPVTRVDFWLCTEAEMKNLQF